MENGAGSYQGAQGGPIEEVKLVNTQLKIDLEQQKIWEHYDPLADKVEIPNNVRNGAAAAAEHVYGYDPEK